MRFYFKYSKHLSNHILFQVDRIFELRIEFFGLTAGYWWSQKTEGKIRTWLFNRRRG